MLWLLVVTALGAAGLLGSVADQTATIGAWSYAAWPAAAVFGLLAVHSATRVVRTSGLEPELGSDRLGMDPPGVGRFRQRLGGWGSYVAGVGYLFGMVTAVAALALVVAETIAPGGELAVRFLAVLVVVVLVGARAAVPEPHRLATAAVVTIAVLGLLGIGMHLDAVAAGRIEEARPRAPVEALAVMEATALLTFVFLPIIRMSWMLPGVPGSRGAMAQRWGAPLTALAAVGFGLFLGQGIERVLDPVSTTGTALAQAVSDCGPWVGFSVRFVTLVLGVVLILMFLDDTQIVGGRMSRNNAVRDVFTPDAGQRVALTGEIFILLLAVLALLLAPEAQALVGFSAFCFILLAGALHVAALRARRGGVVTSRWVPVVGLGASAVLLFSLSPEVTLTGVGLVSLAVSLRAIFVVWAEPLVPDIVEGLEGLEGREGPGLHGAGEPPGARERPSPAAESPSPSPSASPSPSPSATATRRAEDAPGDLPADDRAGRPEHRPEG